MSENITLIIFSLFFLVLGVMNIKGDISSIHWYHRTKITVKNKAKYGKMMGIGTIVIAISLLLAGVLMYFTDNSIPEYIVLIGFSFGIVIMIFAQIKYNKGVF